MDNIYHQYWQQELMYQLASADRCRKRAYVCSPFRADTREQCEKNLRTARAYMFYANKKMNMNAAAPHAYLPLLLCDEIPAERAIALRFGLEILEQSDVMLVCGNKLSNGMRGEIAKAALLRMPITVFDEGLYLEVQKLVTQNNGNKKSVKLDEETAPMVKRMFEMVADGNTLHYVATTLNSEGIPSPGRLLYDRGIASTDHFKNSKWYMQTIKRILTEEVYLGWMISGKFRSTYHSTGQKGSRPAPKEEWIVTKGTHEPIVTKELFDQVQLYFQRLKEELGQAAVYDSKSKRASIFKGHLRCGECGQAMFLRNKKNHAGERVPWYYCSLHENYNSSYCIKKAVKKQDVEDIALKLIRTQIKLFTDARELLAALNKKESSKTKFRIYSDQIRGVKKQIDRYVSLKASLYEEFANGTLSQNDYISMGQEYAAKADELRIFLAELEKECQKYNPSFAASGSWAELIEQYKDADTLTAEMVDAFIDEMILYNNGHVEVKFNFRNELDEVIHLAAIRQREVERYAM